MNFCLNRCSSSPVLRTRQISAKALQPMVVGCRILKVLTDLMTQIPKSEGGVYYSHLHGILLQVYILTYVKPTISMWSTSCNVKLKQIDRLVVVFNLNTSYITNLQYMWKEWYSLLVENKP